MSARRGDLHRPLHVLLTADQGHIEAVQYGGPARIRRRLRLIKRPEGLFTADVFRKLTQIGGGEHLNAIDKRRLRRVDRRNDDLRQAALPRQGRHWQHALRVSNLPLKRELTQKGDLIQREIHPRLPGPDEDARGDGQVIGRPHLFEVRR